MGYAKRPRLRGETPAVDTRYSHPGRSRHKPTTGSGNKGCRALLYRHLHEPCPRQPCVKKRMAPKHFFHKTQFHAITGRRCTITRPGEPAARSRIFLRDSREPQSLRHTPPAPGARGGRQISPSQPRARSHNTEQCSNASGAGEVGESLPGRRDPGGAQAGADTSRQPVRGKSQSKSQWKENRQVGREGDWKNKTKGHTQENNNR